MGESVAVFETHQEHRENGLLDFALERGHRISAAIDYLDVAMTVPLDDECHKILNHVHRILVGAKH